MLAFVQHTSVILHTQTHVVVECPRYTVLHVSGSNTPSSLRVDYQCTQFLLGVHLLNEWCWLVENSLLSVGYGLLQSNGLHLAAIKITPLYVQTTAQSTDLM